MSDQADAPKLPFQDHYSIKPIKGIARLLRIRLTKSEKILWQAIRKRQIDGHKFLRQHPIGVSVVDFYCHEKRLVIEIDGGIHSTNDAKLHDQYRQKLIELYGISFFRCSAEEVEVNLESVLHKLRTILRDTNNHNSSPKAAD